MTRWTSGRKPSPATVISVIALFVALGGTALAAGLAKNSVKSKQIKNRQVRTVDLAAAAVGSAKLAVGAVTSAKVADNSLTGGVIDEGSLSDVPIADGSVTGAKLAAGSVTSDKFLLNTTVSIDFASLAAGTCASNTQDSGVFTQVQFGDQVIVTPPENKPPGLTVTSGTFDALPTGVFIDVCAINGTIDAPPGDYEITVIR